MPRNLDVALLRTFVTIADRRSITGAAGSLNLTQGAISQQLAKLEQAFRLRLFSRDHRGVLITPDGERLLPQARGIVDASDQLLADATGTAPTRHVRLGAPPEIVAGVLPAVLRSISEQLPNITLMLESAPSAVLEAALQERRLDLALIQQRVTSLAGHVLLVEPLQWVGAINGQAWRRRPRPLSIVHSACRFRAEMHSALSECGQAWLPVLDDAGYDNTIAALRADMAIGAFQPSTIPAGLEMIQDSSLPPLPDYALSLHLVDEAVPDVEAAYSLVADEMSGQFTPA